MNELLSASSEDGFVETMEKQSNEDREHMEKAVERAHAQPSIQQVLTGNGCDRRDLEALYRRTEIQALPPELREVALCNPGLLDFFLKNSTVATEQREYRRSVKDTNIHLLLGIWVMQYPAADRPPSNPA